MYSNQLNYQTLFYCECKYTIDFCLRNYFLTQELKKNVTPLKSKKPSTKWKAFHWSNYKPVSSFIWTRNNTTSFRYRIWAKKPFCYERLSPILRSGRDSNPRPHAWQACILTNWTTKPLLYCGGKDTIDFRLHKPFIREFQKIFNCFIQTFVFQLGK